MSGQEVLFGPLDIAREVQSEAEYLGDLILDQTAEFLIEYDNLEERVLMLDQQHPFYGREIIAYGTVLTESVNDHGGMIPLSIPPKDQEPAPVKGIYKGFCVVPAYVPDQDTSVLLLVHQIRTGSASILNDFYNSVTTNYNSYVLVHDSEILPVIPQHSHSLFDLRNDRITREIDWLVFNDDDTVRRTKKVIDLVSRIFAKNEDQFELNLERVSYLNSLELFNDVIVVTNDVAIANREDYLQATDVAFSETNADLELLPEMLDLLPGYIRLPGGEVLLGGAPELCATAENHDGRRIIMPLSKITDIKKLEG
jgi:hypothetical protein